MKLYGKLMSAALAVCLLLSGCTGADKTESGDASEEAQPTHITREVSAYFQIDAEVIAPEGNVTPIVYRTELPATSIEHMNDFLTIAGEEMGAVEDYPEGDERVIEGTTEKGNSVYLYRTEKTKNNARFLFYYSAAVDVQQKDDPVGICVKIMNPHEPYCTIAAPMWDNRELYTQPRELSCGTVDEAKQLLTDALTALQVSGDLVYDLVLYADHETMNLVYESDFLKNYYDLLKKDVPEMSPTTEESDAIFLAFSWAVDGIPICSSMVWTATEQFDGEFGTFQFSKNGIDTLYFIQPFQPVEALEEVSVLSATEACDIAEELLGGLVDHERTLVQISLEYYPTQDGDRWILKPIWVFTTLVKDYFPSSPDECEIEHYYIDAVTGDEI